ncbi:MAG: cation:proton antiporter [Fimbriimonadaceae bacterium]|nr:sodium:proton antiporter [Chthonomonadaceae bacterium]MCO5296917.1 cation:proton antiporter [Fimbriimonadaceae bacterium]
MTEQITLQLATVLIVGIASQWVAWRLRVPAIVLMLVSGVVLGPVLGFLRPDEILGRSLLPFVSLSVALILFEGGMSLKWREIFARKRLEPEDAGGAAKRPRDGSIGVAVLLLVVVGGGITFGLGAVAASQILGFDIRMSVLLAAVLTVTGPTVIGPLLRTVRPSGKSGTILKWEGILIDPLGAIAAVLVFEFLFGEPAAEPLRAATLAFVNTLLSGAGIGLLGAGLTVLFVRQFWVPDFLINPVALAVVFVAFSTANLVQAEAGLVAVTVMGVALSNQPWIHVHPILEFKENLRVLLISALFVLLAARVELAVLQEVTVREALFVLALIVLIRPISVLVGLAPARIRWPDRLFLAGVAPRGIVAAAVSSIFALRLQEMGYPDAERLASTTFLVIVSTVVVYGFGAMPLARRLKISREDPKGFIIAGANPLGRALAASLAKLEFQPLLLDTNPDYVAEAERQELPALWCDWLQEEDREEIELANMGSMLALTSNDHANRLLAEEGMNVFGRANVFQLPAKSRETVRGKSREPAGRVLFGADWNYEALVEKIRKGWQIQIEGLETEEDAAQRRQQGFGESIPLATVHESGRLEFIEAGAKASTKKGARNLLLAPPA